jgi:hypothetical protein
MRRTTLAVMLNTRAHLTIQRLTGGDIGHSQRRLSGQALSQSAFAGTGTAKNQFMHGSPLFEKSITDRERGFSRDCAGLTRRG